MGTRNVHVREATGTLTAAQQRSLFELPQRREFLVRHLPARRNWMLGCATGCTAELARRVGHEVVGSELNISMATRARRRGIEVLKHDLEEPLPLPACSFNLVTLRDRRGPLRHRGVPAAYEHGFKPSAACWHMQRCEVEEKTGRSSTLEPNLRRARIGDL